VGLGCIRGAGDDNSWYSLSLSSKARISWVVMVQLPPPFGVSPELSEGHPVRVLQFVAKSVGQGCHSESVPSQYELEEGMRGPDWMVWVEEQESLWVGGAFVSEGAFVGTGVVPVRVDLGMGIWRVRV